MGAAAIVALLDVAFKYYALARLPESGRVSFPIDLLLHKNQGIAFNIPVPMSLVIIFTLAVLLTVPPFALRWWENRPERSVAAITIAIGALGNMLDRIVHGFTTDYILLFGRSVINLSDILIIVGTILLLIYTEDRRKDEKI